MVDESGQSKPSAASWRRQLPLLVDTAAALADAGAPARQCLVQERDAIIRQWETTRDRLVEWRLERADAMDDVVLERAQQEAGITSAIVGVLEARVAECEAAMVALDVALAQLDALFDYLSVRLLAR